MSMVVQHNLQAINSNRMLGITTSAQSKSTEKLSSGYKINRAADDAAGLTISEKMRKQIRGLDRASTNAQDGVSAVQTAEGALTEVHSMLQRMNELAVQAANGTNSEADRKAIQDEVNALSTEIDRVAETTKFNEIYLLKGDENAKTETVNLKAHDAGLKGKLTDNGDGTATFVMDELKGGDTVSIGGQNYTIVDDMEQTEAKEGEAYTVTKGTAATATVDLTTNPWTTGGTLTIAGVTVTQAAANDVDAIVAALGADANFSDKYTAEKDGSGNLLITSKDNSVTKEDLLKDITEVKYDATNDVTPTATDNVADAYEIKEGAKLYAKDSKEALTADKAKEALAKGETLYTTPGTESTQKEAEVKKVDGKAATATVDLTTNAWTTNGTLTIAGVTVTQAAANTVADIVTALEADTNFSDKYTAEEDGSGNLLITAKDNSVTKEDLLKDITDVKYDGTNDVTPTATDNVADSYEGTYYAKGGTKALTADEVAEAVKNGDTLYSNAFKAGKNEITAAEAYKLAAKELKKANQVGDTLGTANVSGADDSAEGDNVGKTAADYTVGQKVKVGDTEYTVGDTEDNVNTAIADAISAAVAADTSTPSNAAGQALTKIGTVSDGTTDINVFKAYDGSVKYDTAASLSNTGANAAPAGNKTAADVAALAAAGATVTFTPAAGDATVAAVADDANGTVITAAKAAELENEAAKAAAEGEETVATGPNVFNITTGSTETAATLSFNLHVGSDADLNNKIQVNIDTMNSAFLGIKNLDVIGEGNDGGIAGTYAIDAIADAIAKVSAQRSALGAVQNRLEHTISNLDNVVENTTAAESRIRDTDMAEEMVEYSKNNILAQAGQSMLAQANQSTQGVLSLLG